MILGRLRPTSSFVCYCEHNLTLRITSACPLTTALPTILILTDLGDVAVMLRSKVVYRCGRKKKVLSQVGVWRRLPKTAISYYCRFHHSHHELPSHLAAENSSSSHPALDRNCPSGTL
jgi:hypothetical protein